ncbi:hypothetical protein OSTOST_15114, partial [Ostertagia ostertagi]
MSKPLGNKPGEPPFQLKVDPDTKSNARTMISDIFRVRPPLSFVKADETAVVK